MRSKTNPEIDYDVMIPTYSELHEKWKRDVASLSKTLYRIKNVSPAMGEKWKSGMIRYYSDRLRELEINEPIE